MKTDFRKWIRKAQKCDGVGKTFNLNICFSQCFANKCQDTYCALELISSFYLEEVAHL